MVHAGLVAGRRLGDAALPGGYAAVGVAGTLAAEGRQVGAEARDLLGR